MAVTLDIEHESLERIAERETQLAAPVAAPTRPVLTPIWPADADRPLLQRKLSFTESLIAVACLRVGILPRVTGRHGD